MAGRDTKLGEVFANNPDNAAKMILKSARKHNGHRSDMARDLDVSRTTLYLTIESLDTMYGHDVGQDIDDIAEAAATTKANKRLAQLNKSTRSYLKDALGHIRYAAELAGVSQNSFYKWMRQLEHGGYDIREYAKKLRSQREQHRLYA